MQATSLSGGFRNAPIDAARAFRAAMSAMARPGRSEAISGAEGPRPLSRAAATLLLTLADAETPVFLAGAWDAPEVRDWMTFHTGAPLAGADRAMFAVGDWDALQPLDRFAIGSPDYPDRSATLIVERTGAQWRGASLSGPGIKDAASMDLPEVAAFQSNRALFPLGLDFYFTEGDRVTALPRTTSVEAA